MADRPRRIHADFEPAALEVTLPENFELTVVIPTFNERGNVEVLVERLRTCLAGIAWQAIFVDDNSEDGTCAAVKAIAVRDSRIQCLRRIGRRGLAGAVIEGAMASAAPFVAVIDADLQHDESLLPKMLQILRADQADLVIGSRYLEGGDLDEGLTPSRRLASRAATWLARRVLRVEASDPVSGFFMIRRELIDRVAPKLSSQGFKILFDIITAQPKPPRVVELPYRFARRLTGQSKFDEQSAIDYLGLLVSKLTGNLLPPRALLFLMVGASGLVVHLAVLSVAIKAHLAFALAQFIAAMIAMTSNFALNNAVTFRDKRLKGRRLLTGYLRFCALCTVGLIANVAVADLVHRATPLWWLAGLSGAAFGAAWNYVSTSLAVW